MSHRFVWVDIPVRELERAIAFYIGRARLRGDPRRRARLHLRRPRARGKRHRRVPRPFDEGQRALGARPARLSQRRSPHRRCRKKRSSAHGGRVVQPTEPIGPHGYRAIVVDSEGNRVALHSMTR
jgi:hypothetical protein